jgi:hypothetical protein
MKKLLLSTVLFTLTYYIFAQAGISSKDQSTSGQSDEQLGTATVKSATRLFKVKDDLTSVITIIPAGTEVSYIDSDSTYMHVIFDSNEGFIFKKHAKVTAMPATDLRGKAQPETQVMPENQPAPDQPDDRYAYLVNKYGDSMAERIAAGKIWKGMNSEMVKDSWGTAEKINRIVNNNTIKEEWIYRSTWLFFENNTLVQWGPTKNR